MRVEVTIDRLVLRGVPPESAYDVRAALEARLAALGVAWAETGGRARPREEASRRLPPVAAPAGEPASLGERVADSVWSAALGERR